MRKQKKQVNDFERSSITYFSEIGKYNGLSRDEEFSLWKDYKENNNIKSRDKLITANLKFVASVAKGYQGLGLSYADLIAEGNTGLFKAVERFDGNKGYKFISYAVTWIKQSILEALSKRNSIFGDGLPDDYEAQQDFYDDNDSEEQTNSLFSTFVSDDMDDMFKSEDVSNAVTTVMKELDKRERYIISKYYGLDGTEAKTLEEIGREIGLTKERVRQIKEKALKKLRTEALNNFITADIYR